MLPAPSAPGGTSTTYYNITAEACTNGIAKADKHKPQPAVIYNITLTAKTRYEPDNILRDGTCKATNVIGKSNGTRHSATMPSTSFTRTGPMEAY